MEKLWLLSVEVLKKFNKKDVNKFVQLKVAKD